MFKEERKKCYKGFGLCLLAFLLGFVMLEWISITEDPPLGNTFYIIAGNFLMVAAVLGVFLIVRYLFRLKKKERKKRSANKVVFLNDEKKSKKSGS